MRTRNNKQKRLDSRRHGNSSNNVWKLAIAAVVIVLLAVLFINRSSSTNVNGYEGKVRAVKNGNTIVLDDGLTVELLGVFDTSESRKFLEENVIGHRVRLIADSKDLNATFKDPSKDKVKAYVQMIEASTYSNVNGSILRLGKSSFNNAYCQDSMSVFQKYDKGKNEDEEKSYALSGPSRSLLSSEELGKKITPATFLILTNGVNGAGLGTGFFINDAGLALTNYHVLANALDADNLVVFLSDEEGNISQDRNRPFGRILHADQKRDFVIFTVRMDNKETVPYLPLAKERPQRGTKVGIVGNPQGLIATYTTGQISAIREEDGKIQTDASMTFGNSGGPICNFYGEVVGIAQSVFGDSDGKQVAANLNFGVDILLVREALDELKDPIAKNYAGKK